MKKLTLLSVTILSFLLMATVLSCKKKSACEEDNTGTLSITNKTSLTLVVTIQGSGDYTLCTGETKSVTVSASVHSYSAVDTGGSYTWSGTKDIIQCTNTSLELIL